MTYSSHRRVSQPILITLASIFCLASVDFLFRISVFREGLVIRPPPAPETVIDHDNDIVDIVKRLQGWIPVEEQGSGSRAVSPDSLLLRAIYVKRESGVAVIGLKGSDNVITKYVRATVGSSVEGWDVIEINPNRVILTQGDVRHELALFKSVRSDPNLEKTNFGLQ